MKGSIAIGVMTHRVNHELVAKVLRIKREQMLNAGFRRPERSQASAG